MTFFDMISVHSEKHCIVAGCRMRLATDPELVFLYTTAALKTRMKSINMIACDSLGNLAKHMRMKHSLCDTLCRLADLPAYQGLEEEQTAQSPRQGSLSRSFSELDHDDVPCLMMCMM